MVQTSLPPFSTYLGTPAIGELLTNRHGSPHDRKEIETAIGLSKCDDHTVAQFELPQGRTPIDSEDLCFDPKVVVVRREEPIGSLQLREPFECIVVGSLFSAIVRAELHDPVVFPGGSSTTVRRHPESVDNGVGDGKDVPLAR